MVSPSRSELSIYDPFLPGRVVTKYESSSGNYFKVLGSQRVKEGRIDQWELRISDLRGGLDVLEGDLENTHDRSRASTLDTRFLRKLILPSLVTAAATPDISANPPRLCSANIFDLLVMAGGSTTNAAYFKETSATNPVVAAITFAPAGTIACTVPVNWGSATVAKMLLIGYTNAAADLISDASGTKNADCHADVNPLWGAVPTILPDNPILLYIGNTIRIVNGTSAATTQPTSVLSGGDVKGGGYEVGLFSLGPGELRAWWVFPKQHTTTGMLVDNAIKFGSVVSTNMEGGDLRELPIDLSVAKQGIVHVVYVPARNAMVLSDRINSLIHTGTQLIDTKHFANRVPNSDTTFRVQGFWVNGPDVRALVQVRNNPFSSATPATTWHVEEYNWNTGAWHQISAETTLSTNGDLGLLSGSSLPFSAQTGFMHWYGDGSWYRQFQPPPGQDLFTFRETSGAAAASGQAFAASGTWTGPYWEFPGYMGCPKITTEVIFGGTIESLGTPTTGATVAWSDGAGPTATFEVDNNGWRQVRTFHNNHSAFFQFRPTCTVTQQTGGTDPTRLTPNALPVIFRGFVFVKESSTPEWLDDPRGK